MKDLHRDVQDCYTKISDISSKLQKQDDDILTIKEELKNLLSELAYGAPQWTKIDKFI